MDWHQLMRWLTPLLLAAASWTAASAQGPPANPPAPTPAEEKPERPAPALQYTAAILCALLVLTIVCKPSRKS